MDREPAQSEGPAWSRGLGDDGIVILSSDVLGYDFSALDLAAKIVVHEFAHALDWTNGALDGVPRIEERQVGAWRGLLEQELVRLRGASAEATALREGADQNEAELFARAAEAFFFNPSALSTLHPDLYALLSSYFHQDPANQAG